jgi:hypothetical protein
VSATGPPRARIAIDGVEWLAAIWALTDDDPCRSANPHLVALLHLEPRLLAHDACRMVGALRRTQTRDQLVKRLVTASYDASGTAAAEPLAAALRGFAHDVESWWGSAMTGFIAAARAVALDRASRIAGPLPAAEHLAELTGEPLAFRVVLGPSVFLPAPQAGRHGALVQLPSETVAHLHFGFPLHAGKQPFTFNREWFLGGAWHYAIQTYLGRYWPPVRQRLARRHDLLRALRRVLGSVPSRRRPAAMTTTAVLDALATHVNFAMKGALYRRLGLRDGLHRALAEAEGLILFPWVEQWLREGVDGAIALPAHLPTMPEALAATRAQWEDLRFEAVVAPPTAVNIALASMRARSATLVVPDEWSETTAAAAVAGWELLSLPRLRYSEWSRERHRDTSAVIAVGEPEHNALVRGVLEQRGLSLAHVNAPDPAIIALSEPGFAGRDWCLAVAVTRPETAARLHIEMALAQPNSYIVCDGGAVIAPGAPAAPDDARTHHGARGRASPDEHG